MDSVIVQHEVHPFVPNEQNWIYMKLPVQIATMQLMPLDAYLKIAFNKEAVDDRTRTVFRIHMVIDDLLNDATTDDDEERDIQRSNFRGVYEGFLLGNLAVSQSSIWGHDEVVLSPSKQREAVRIWLDDAQDALVGNVEKLTREYKYFIQVDGSENTPEPRIVFTWKKNLDPFGSMPLGSVRMRGSLFNEKLSKSCKLMLDPLISRLHSEQKSQLKFKKQAEKREECLLQDNRLLLNQLERMVNKRKAEDRQLTARFMKLLNTKKQRIVELEQQLAKFKGIENKAIIVSFNRMADRRRRCCSDLHGAVYKIKRFRSEKDLMSRNEDSALGNIDTNHQLPELMAINGCEGDNISDVVVSPKESDVLMSTTPPISSVVPISSAAVNLPVDPKYLADTQIDSSNSSPRSLQQPMEVSPPLVQPSSDQHDEHQPPTNDSVLNDLWSGIL